MEQNTQVNKPPLEQIAAKTIATTVAQEGVPNVNQQYVDNQGITTGVLLPISLIAMVYVGIKFIKKHMIYYPNRDNTQEYKQN